MTTRAQATTVAPTEVLIVGAGPTGLNLALWLTRLGVRVRLIDAAERAGTTSRAIAVQGRTLEFYRQLGLAEEVLARARPARGLNLWVAGRRIAHADFTRLGAGLSPFPEPVMYPQDEHERLLESHLADLGIAIERSTTLASCTQHGARVQAHVRGPDGTMSVVCASFLAGCDGAHSRVRELIGARFPGGTYDHLFYVADIEGSGPALNGELHVGLEESDFLAVFPLKDAGRARLVGTVATPVTDRTLGWEDVSRRVLAWMDIAVRRVRWFSTYRVHHRVADRFRDQRVFLLGDAAHIHSPVGGQGMNTGIGDAANLAWKLARALRTPASPDALLDSYQTERIGFARRLVATTDRAFAGVTGRSVLARWFRLHLVPRVLPALLRQPAVRRWLYRTVSQTGIRYRDSWLSTGAVGGIHGGDRFPWAPLAAGDDTCSSLGALAWQVHVIGAAPLALRRCCGERTIALRELPWEPAVQVAGLHRHALYLTRPDGYVGLAHGSPDAAVLAAYLDARGL